MAAGEDKEHVPLPPLVYLAGILLGLGIDYLIPVRVFPGALQQPVGALLMALGVGLRSCVGRDALPGRHQSFA